MKKDGLFAGIIQAVVNEEKKKAASGKTPDIAFNQKKQLWYMMMNQIDGTPDQAEDEQEAGKSNNPKI